MSSKWEKVKGKLSKKKNPFIPPCNFSKLGNVLDYFFFNCGTDRPVQNTTSMSLSELYLVEVIKQRVRLAVWHFLPNLQ